MINPAPVLYQTLPAMINLAPVLNLTIVAMINSAPVLCYQNSTSNTKVPQICPSIMIVCNDRFGPDREGGQASWLKTSGAWLCSSADLQILRLSPCDQHCWYKIASPWLFFPVTVTHEGGGWPGLLIAVQMLGKVGNADTYALCTAWYMI